MPSIVDVSGDRIAWREAGPADTDTDTGAGAGAGAEATIVLLHGLGGSRISWEPQLAGLSDRFRVVAWDMPGYGASPPLDGPMTFAALADAVAGLITELGEQRVHLVGISFGGMIAQYAAVRHPALIDTLTLLSTSPQFGLDGTRPDEWRAARLAPLDLGLEPADIAERVLGSLAGPHISPAAMAGQIAAMSRITGVALRRSIDCLITHDSRAVLPRVAAPTLCMVGELDDETPPAYAMAVADLVPGARLTVVEGAGHLLNVEAPEAVNDAVIDHIDRAASLTDRRSP